ARLRHAQLTAHKQPISLFQLRHAQPLLRMAQGTWAGPVLCYSASFQRQFQQIDLENRIQKLERVIAKLKEA
ncbi:hypothetical protein L195_g037624, partial [Trifolium pratense]